MNRELRLGVYFDDLQLNNLTSSQRSAVSTALQTLSALPKLQYLRLDLDLVTNWSTFYDAEMISDLELLSILKDYKPWDSIRFLYIPGSGSSSFMQEMLKSHLPNLIGLDTKENYLIWETQEDEQQSSQSAGGIEPRPGSLSNLRRLILSPNDYDEPLQDRLEGFTFGVASLKRVSETFKKLEWLYIRALRDCVNAHFLPRGGLPTDLLKCVRNDNERFPKRMCN